MIFLFHAEASIFSSYFLLLLLVSNIGFQDYMKVMNLGSCDVATSYEQFLKSVWRSDCLYIVKRFHNIFYIFIAILTRCYI